MAGAILHPFAPEARALWRGRTVRDAIGVAWDVGEAHEPLPLLEDSEAAVDDEPEARPRVTRVAAGATRLLDAGLVSYCVPERGALLLTATVEDLVAAGERGVLRDYLNALPAALLARVPALQALEHFAAGSVAAPAKDPAPRDEDELWNDGLVPALLRGWSRRDVGAELAELGTEFAVGSPELSARAAVLLARIAKDRDGARALLDAAEERAAHFSVDCLVAVGRGVWDALADKPRTLALLVRAGREARPWWPAWRPRAAVLAFTAQLFLARARFRLLGDLPGTRAALEVAEPLARRSPWLTLELAGDAVALLADTELAARLVDAARNVLGPTHEDVLRAERHLLAPMRG